VGSSTGILGRMSFRVEVWDSRLRGNDGGGCGIPAYAGMTVVDELLPRVYREGLEGEGQWLRIGQA